MKTENENNPFDSNMIVFLTFFTLILSHTLHRHTHTNRNRNLEIFVSAYALTLVEVWLAFVSFWPAIHIVTHTLESVFGSTLLVLALALSLSFTRSVSLALTPSGPGTHLCG